MLVYFFVLFSDDSSHFLNFFFELTVLTVNPNDNFFIGFDRDSYTLGDIGEKVLFGDDL